MVEERKGEKERRVRKGKEEGGKREKERERDRKGDG